MLLPILYGTVLAVSGINVSKKERITIKTIDVGIEGVKESFQDAVSFGFASECELTIAQSYCSKEGKEDTFCKSGLLNSCELLRPKCIGFEIDRCSDDIECCQCSFVDCPLSKAACNKIAEECFYADFVTLQLEDNEIKILRKLFEKFDEDADGMLNFSETMSLIEKAETNATKPANRLADRPSKKKSLPTGKIIINERVIEKTTVKNLGREDFEKLCVTVSENPSKVSAIDSVKTAITYTHMPFLTYYHL
uniref:EF-hand domain-containing protein n=1 Tax=Bigelowiella natans TaxID=227086 RepID=A0A7S2KMT9_BIGNA|mmetsp:Transcript_872/g.1348  ORF Transcript_872/g.1348 Transcript_872/m.1348 type:complete len:251 (+) Transcript_872:49-801(+)